VPSLFDRRFSQHQRGQALCLCTAIADRLSSAARFPTSKVYGVTTESSCLTAQLDRGSVCAWQPISPTPRFLREAVNPRSSRLRFIAKFRKISSCYLLDLSSQRALVSRTAVDILVAYTDQRRIPSAQVQFEPQTPPVGSEPNLRASNFHAIDSFRTMLQLLYRNMPRRSA
jgi:hypothetical protein